MKPLTAAATGMTNTKFGSTLSNDPLADKRFDFQFVNPPYGYEWSKHYDVCWQFGVSFGVNLNN